jgi:hypothetical protein
LLEALLLMFHHLTALCTSAGSFRETPTTSIRDGRQPNRMHQLQQNIQDSHTEQRKLKNKKQKN